MREETQKELVGHMIDFGLHLLGRGVVNATFNEAYIPYNHAMGIVHIAHGTEILIKARIAQEHPLLIFSTIPKSVNAIDTKLGILDLLEKGQTIIYSELPERLWAATGCKIPNLELFNSFGKTRNMIIHLGVPEGELDDIGLKFAYSIIEPLVNEWWNETIIEYACTYDDVYPEYIFQQLDRLKIETKYEIDENYHLRKKGENEPFRFKDIM